MKKQNIVAIVLFCSFLAVMAAGFFFPKPAFSEMEKRYLAAAPKLSWKNVLDGTWGKQLEDYLIDHIPGRNLFVGIHAYAELLAGRQKVSDIWLAEDKLLEAPVEMDEGIIARNMNTILTFADTVDQEVHVMVVPSAGWAAGVEGYTDEETMDAIAAAAGKNVSVISVGDLYSGKPELYYNTDHHWTSRGAFYGYKAFMEAVGKEYRQEREFTVTQVPDFRGSTYSRSALWLFEGDTMELWHGSDQLTVTNAETEARHEGIFYWERLEEADKYTVFLDGNHSLVRVQNPEKTGKVLVIRDSYSNCLGGFLAQSYGEVVLVDLRYYRQPVSRLAQEETFDDILVCYSCANFLTDTNLMLLK